MQVMAGLYIMVICLSYDEQEEGTAISPHLRKLTGSGLVG